MQATENSADIAQNICFIAYFTTLIIARIAIMDVHKPTMSGGDSSAGSWGTLEAKFSPLWRDC